MKSLKSLQSVFLAGLLVSGAACLATAAPSRAAAADSVEFEEDFSLPVAYIHIIVDAGATNDPENKLGLANVASRMLLRGTQKHSKTDFNELLNRLGGEFDLDVRDEGTVFAGAVLSENIEKFLVLVDEALSKPKFTAQELAKLKKETEGEILERKGNDKSLVQYNYYRYLYGTHPYGHPLIGTQKGVKSINYKDILNYYVQHFGGRTMRLFGTGAVKKEVVQKWFTALTEKLNALHPEARPVDSLATPAISGGRRTLLIDKPQATQAQVLMGGTGMRPETTGFYAITLGNYPFGGHSFEARMMREIRVKRGWTYGASNAFRFGRQPKHYSMYVFPKTEDTPPAIALSLTLFEEWVKNGVTRDEYNFSRDSLVNNAPFNYDTSKKRLENATMEYLMNFPHGYFRDFATNIGKVQFEEIAPALKTFFKPENLTLTVVGDAKKLKEPLSKLPGFSAPEVKSYLED